MTLVFAALVSTLVNSISCERRKIDPQLIPSSSATLRKPKLVVPETEHEFGFLVVGQSTEYSFELKNEGDAPLEITETFSTCSCTVVELADRTLAPGGTTRLKVRYRPNSLTGPDHQTLRISTNDPERATLELTVTATILPEIRFEPSKLKLSVEQGQPIEAVSQLKGNSVLRSNLHLAEVRGDPKFASQVQVTVRSGPYDARLRPEIRAALRSKPRQTGRVVAVVLTGLPDPTQILVPIEW